MPTIFDPVTIGELELQNRIVMSPLTRCHALPGVDVPHALNATYYTQRATAGLIVSEATMVSRGNWASMSKTVVCANSSRV